MANTKIYGIDLGTTNSLVSYNGELITGLVPSVANVMKKEAGIKFKYDVSDEISRSFKPSMGLGVEGLEAVEASSLVLKDLQKCVKETTGEDMKRVVISVPASFNSNERKATIKAANKIGLVVEDIVSEPTAAAIKYNSGNKGIVVVYDLGGGTFDISVVDNRTGVYTVRGTEGCKVGGVDLDNAIQQLVRAKSGMKTHRIKRSDLSKLSSICENAKIQIQKERKDIEIDMSQFDYCDSTPVVKLTVQEYVMLIGITFGETIKMTQEVISSSIAKGEEYKIVLVGGSTRCPYLRALVETRIQHELEPITYDPDTIVAEGVGLYARLKETGRVLEMVQEITKAFGLEMSDGTIKAIVPANSKLPVKCVTRVVNSTNATGMSLNIYQGNNIMANLNSYVGTLNYKYSTPKQEGEGELYVTLYIDTDGILEVTAREPLLEGQSTELMISKC